MKAMERNRHDAHGGGLNPPLHRFYTSSILSPQSQPSLSAIGLHPGAVSGYFFCQADNILRARAAIDKHGSMPALIYGVDDGSCADLEALSHAQGLLSTNASPNAWCAVQAKCEGVPTVIGLIGSFGKDAAAPFSRTLQLSNNGNEVELVLPAARTIMLRDEENQEITLCEGDRVTIDGNSGHVYIGTVDIQVSAIQELYRLLTAVMQEAIALFGPAQAWTRFRETPLYQRERNRLATLAGDQHVLTMQEAIRLARTSAPIKVMATAHTADGALQARLMVADIDINDAHDIVLTPNNGATGVGLLRTERLFRDTDTLDALRILVLGHDVVDPPAYAQARATILGHETACLDAIFRANSGCATVVRTLCMPFNKLFPENLHLEAIAQRYPMDIDAARRKIREELHESETFHGCRGARLHMLRHDLATLEIEAILIAAMDTKAAGGDVDLTILVSMVTFPEEIALYMELFDRVYEKILNKKSALPSVKLATMIETSAVYHNIEKFIHKKGRHIQFAGALFGGNDFTAATLNLNRHDAVKNVIPRYMELGILRHNPFLSLHTETVGQTICSGLRRIRRACDGRALTVGFGGEQAGDARSVAWLSRHAAPEGLSYVTTSPDRIVEALLAAANANER